MHETSPTPLGLLPWALLVLCVLWPTCVAQGAAPSRHVAGGASVTAKTSAPLSSGDLEFGLRAAPGPYFVGEVVQVRVALVNHSPRPVWYIPRDSRARLSLGPPLFVSVDGGSPPFYVLPPYPFHGGPGPTAVRLEAGRRVDTDGFAILTASGHLTLAAQARFYTPSDQQGRSQWQEIRPVLRGGSFLHILVAPTVPPTRLIRLHRVGRRIYVVVPPGIHPQTTYGGWLSCTYPASKSSAHREYLGVGDFGEQWAPTPRAGIVMPRCSGGGIEHLQVLVRAPGYVFAAARY